MPGWERRLLIFFPPIICPNQHWVALIPFHWRCSNGTWSTSFYKQGKVSPRDPVCIFCSLYHHFNSGSKTRDKQKGKKNLPRLPSGKVELKLERGITWTKTPRGREWQWKRKKKERKGDRGSVMGCCCSVLGMIKQWGWIRALSYDKQMHTQTHAHTDAHKRTHTTVSHR